jgi:hypothetical protein
MNWLHVADRIRAYTCMERQRYGRCNCRSGKGARAYNPCSRAEGHAQTCEGLAEGRDGDAPAVAAWLAKHACSRSRMFHNCAHPSCARTERAVLFVREWLYGLVSA